MNEHLRNLVNYCEEYEIYDFVSPVLESARFEIWSGSGSPECHHYGNGGLLRHTSEVAMFCFDIAARYQAMGSKVNISELLVSAIWHDYGKIWDYQLDNGVWGKYDTHSRQIHHITRSVLEFDKWYDRIWGELEIDFSRVDKENVIHNILSHHGQREWGSPVAPATKEAWILHLSDNLSARLDDCGKHDRFKN